MIAKTFEWYRIVAPVPNSTAVEARTKAATEISGSLLRQNQGVLLSMAQGIARDFDSGTDAAAIDLLLKTLKSHDPAVSENIVENQMELRCLAAIVVGELLFKASDKPGKQATLLAAALTSALALRPVPAERYLKVMIDEVHAKASEVLERAADVRRRRSEMQELDLKAIAAETAVTMAYVTALQTQLTVVNRNSAIDREELNLLWFVASGFSKTAGKPFSSESLSVAALRAAIELYEYLLLPATSSCFEVLTSMIESKRDSSTLKPAALKEFVKSWGSSEGSLLAPANSQGSELGSRYPGVFPMTWIGNRLRETGNAPNWSDFKKSTGLKADTALAASQLGKQVLHERVTLSFAGD